MFFMNVYQDHLHYSPLVHLDKTHAPDFVHDLFISLPTAQVKNLLSVPWSRLPIPNANLFFQILPNRIALSSKTQKLITRPLGADFLN